MQITQHFGIYFWYLDNNQINVVLDQDFQSLNQFLLHLSLPLRCPLDSLVHSCLNDATSNYCSFLLGYLLGNFTRRLVYLQTLIKYSFHIWWFQDDPYCQVTSFWCTDISWVESECLGDVPPCPCKLLCKLFHCPGMFHRWLRGIVPCLLSYIMNGTKKWYDILLHILFSPWC